MKNIPIIFLWIKLQDVCKLENSIWNTVHLSVRKYRLLDPIVEQHYQRAPCWSVSEDIFYWLYHSIGSINKERKLIIPMTNLDGNVLNGATWSDVPMIIRKSHWGKSCYRINSFLHNFQMFTYSQNTFTESFGKTFTKKDDVCVSKSIEATKILD